MMGTSIGVTHGIATKKNATGKAKWRSHGLPPTHHRYKRVRAATEAVWIQPMGRHSGFAISKRRTGSNSSSAAIANASAAEFAICELRFAICVRGGRSRQRSQNRYSAKNGTNHP